ncbi:MAG: SCO1664 family protein [Candidatus Dormibacterales bacterium]
MDPGPSSEKAAARARAPDLDFEASEARLGAAPSIELLGLLHRSSNYTFLVRLSGQGGEEMAIYKPSLGETPLWDFPAGTLFRREVAAYRLSRALGWPLVPPTVVRETAPHGVGALQHFVHADRARHYLGQERRAPETWLPVALFDVLANNADRKSGHCIFDAAGRPWMIDHGLTFHREEKLRTVIWDFAGEPLPDGLRRDLLRVLDDLDRGGAGCRLPGLITRAELAALKRRLRAALDPAWRFPHPTSGWSVPWPLV